MKNLLILLLSIFSAAAAPFGFKGPNIPGIVGWWTFNEGSGTTAADSSGNRNNGTMVGAAWTNGNISAAAALSAAASNVTIAASAALSPTNAISLCAWVRTTNVASSWEYVVRKPYTTGDDDACWQLRIHGGGSHAYFTVNPTGSNGFVNIYAAQNVCDGNWHWLCGAYDGTAANLYIDAVLGASVAKSGSINPGLTNNVYIGGERNSVIGSIDDVRIYNRALSANEVKLLYNGGSGTQR
jgi:hypothetical protein